MELAADEIALWCARPDELADPAAYQAALEVLSAEERRRLQRLRFERDRRRFLAGRALIRNVLSLYHAACSPDSWRFETGVHGKPTIVAEPSCRLQFNLSKTDGLVACGLSSGVAIGVDVECTSRRAPLSIAETCFAPAEQAMLQSLPADQRPGRFFELWTLKESYIKARGLGLTIPLDQFAFDFDEPSPPRIEIDESLQDETPAWQFGLLQPTESHLLAICIGRDQPIDYPLPIQWHSLIV